MHPELFDQIADALVEQEKPIPQPDLGHPLDSRTKVGAFYKLRDKTGLWKLTEADPMGVSLTRLIGDSHLLIPMSLWKQDLAAQRVRMV